MQIVGPRIQTADVAESYITALPSPNLPADQQAQELFVGIADLLRSRNARILQERVFTDPDILPTIRPIRSRAYDELADDVEPTWLAVPPGIRGPLAGVQVHAVTAEQSLEIVRLDNVACGRLFRQGQTSYLALSAISGSAGSSPAEQARLMLEKGRAILKQFGTNMFSVPRTWMWLGNILGWYDEFNRVRNEFFTECGLLGREPTNKMPASTGIGIGPAQPGDCTMDLIAVLEPQNAIEYLDAGGHQNSAFKYGSAFSRGARAPTPAGSGVFVSGTASIDAAGITTHRDDPEGQIEATMSNVRAVLGDMNCADDDVVQALIYCKTPQIEQLFYRKFADLPWPHITTITDVCREDLLFEIEATALVRR